MSNSTPEEIVEQAKKPGVFNIINVLKERAYPKDSVEVSFDEALSFEAAQLNEKIDELSESIKNIDDVESMDKVLDERDKLSKKRDEIVKKITKNFYTFNITGISEGKREELFNETLEKFPVEYRDVSNPIFSDSSKEEVESPERSRLFTNLLWAEHIESIVDPEGNVQGKLSLEEVAVLRENLPIYATSKINEAIEKIRISTAMFMIGVDEDFLAKS